MQFYTSKNNDLAWLKTLGVVDNSFKFASNPKIFKVHHIKK